MEKISAVYKIVNEATGDFYIGSSKDVKRRWWEHKCSSKWKRYPNNPMYKDMQEYGLENFRFQILAPVMPEYLKQVEQEFIEMLQPNYNDVNAKGWNVERHKEYEQSERRKECRRKAVSTYQHKLCLYNDEELTLHTLYARFWRAGIKHPFAEARKYLLNQ